MARFAIWLVAVFVLWRILRVVLKAVIEGMGYQPPGAAGRGQSVGLVRDPICGTFVMPAKAFTSGTGSNTRYFCSEKCRSDYALKG
jgi:YHS domain-containing protein